jgi:hypothetical protein
MACSVFSLLSLAACGSSTTSSGRSVDELKNAGYYVYAFPDQYESQHTWSKVIKFGSFDDQCKDFFANDNWNPIYVNYTDGSQNTFEVRISPQDRIWDSSKTTNEVTLNAAWIPEHKGVYYLTQNGGTVIKAKDSFGMDVIVTSFLSPTALADLISSLEYDGPNRSTISNPWQAACK